jgi:hypothetical protein
MELVVAYPKSNESWYRMLIESVRIWWMSKQVKKFRENDLLID